MPNNKLIFLITGLDYGGAETQLMRLAIQMKNRGWDVKVVSMLLPAAYVKELNNAGVFVESLNMRRGVPDPRALWCLIRILNREKPLILTTFLYHANLLGRLAGRLSGVPIIISSIRNENFGGTLRDIIMRITDWLSDTTVINSHLAAQAILKRKVVNKDRVRVIPNGLVIEKYTKNLYIREKLRKELGIDEKVFLWLAVGRLELQKDHYNLLKAFTKVVQIIPNTQLRIVGKGPLLEELETLVLDLGITSNVKFLGVRTDIPDLLNAADAFVLSSAWEGLPNVVMEALAAGKPVVATQVGGVSELVEEGISGFLVPPKDPDALAHAMIRLMELSPEERKQMGENGRKYIEENYSLDNVVDKWESLYKELLRKKGINIR